MSPASSFCRQGMRSKWSQDKSPDALDPDSSIKLNKGTQYFSVFISSFPTHLFFSNSLFSSYAIAVLLSPYGSDEVDSHFFHQGPESGSRQSWQSHMLHKDLTLAMGKETPSSSGILRHWGQQSHGASCGQLVTM